MTTTIRIHDDGTDVAPATGARATDAESEMSPAQIRWFRDRHGGKSPAELRPQVSDSVAAQEAGMTPQQLRTFRDAHNGYSPIEWDLRGGVR